MTIAAIPTRYNGVQFRSRLEARWAAFFDLCGWRWLYEPLDLPGYIPDFLLVNGARSVLAEVKPSLAYDDAAEAAVAAKAKAASASPLPCPLMLCGIDPAADLSAGFPVLGAMLMPGSDEWDAAIAVDRLGRVDLGCSAREMTVLGGHHIESQCMAADAAELRSAWAEAGNIVQWRGRA